MVRYLGPFQTVCDDWNYWWTYLSEHLSEATAFGFAQRAMLMTTNTTPVQQRRLARARPRPSTAAASTRRRAATSTCTARCTARRSTTRATPTARPASAATRRSSTTRPAGPQPRQRLAHAGRSGPDVRRPRPRARRRDVHPHTANRRVSRPPSRGTTDAAPTRTQSRTQQVQGGPVRDHRDLPVRVPRASRSSPTRSRARTPSTRSSRTPTACSPTRWCGSPASTSARCTSVGAVPGCKIGGTPQQTGAGGRASSAAPPT